MLEAVLFDWGDTLMRWAWDPSLLEAGHRAGLAAIGRGGLPEANTVAARFTETYLPFLWLPGAVEEIEYPGLVRELLGHFAVEVTDEELGRFLEAEHEAWSPARLLGATTHALLESLRSRGLALGLVSNTFDPPWLLHRDLERMGVAERLDVAVCLLLLYVIATTFGLRQQGRPEPGERATDGWSLRAALAALALATAATAVVSEILVHSLDAFAHAAGLSQFFMSAVIVAIVGNAAEHGGALVIARRGKMKLATEIAISSSAQVALFVASAVMLLSFAVGPALALSFRPVELGAMAFAAVVVAYVIRDGHSKRGEGFLLVGLYAVVVAGFWVAGDR